MMHTITGVAVTGTPTLELTYADGKTLTVDLASLVKQGGVFKALADPDFFARVAIGERGRFLVWPDEIELCADALRIGQAAEVPA